jgi:hypothetical protein
MNKEEQRAYNKAWRLAHRAKIRQDRLDQKAFIRLQKVCVDCQQSDIDKLCYHHLDPKTKLFMVSTNTLRSKQTILEELAKCILLCRKCHYKRHNPYLLAYSKTAKSRAECQHNYQVS